MVLMAPPRSPIRVALADDDRHGRLRLRMRQVGLSVLTVLITTWFVMLGPTPAILALVTAKHVLVAILAMGLGVDAPRTAEVRE